MTRDEIVALFGGRQDAWDVRDAGKLAAIPAVIVNGRYEVICPPVTAWRLHKKLPRSKLLMVEGAGQSANEPGARDALLAAMRELE